MHDSVIQLSRENKIFFGGLGDGQGVEDCVTRLEAGVGEGHKAQEYKVQLQL